MEHSIRFEDVHKSFGKTEVIKNLNLRIKKGERLILLGASGCGKSTILRMISGLETITSGSLYLNGELANDVDPGDRSIAMVFQNYALFPHMSVEDNVAYGLSINKVPKAEIGPRVAEALRVLKLTGYEKRLPRELSGGQRQRVALARALVKRADFLLLDEPLSNLDAQLRGQARKELVNIHEMFQQTFVYVTHDQVEAMTIGERVALINQGSLQMLDTPSNVYRRPANIFVATFIGSPSMNIMDVTYGEGKIHFADGQSFRLPDAWCKQIVSSGVQQLKMGMRPEDIALMEGKAAEKTEINVAVHYVEDYGNRVGFYFDLAGAEVISIMPEYSVTDGQNVRWDVNPARLHFFNAATTESIGYPEVL